MLGSSPMAIWATEADAERLKILLESRKQPVVGSETTNQENGLHHVVTLICVGNKALTLTGVRATRLCCSKPSMIACMDGSNKSATL
jgi:hypothetical protein